MKKTDSSEKRTFAEKQRVNHRNIPLLSEGEQKRRVASLVETTSDLNHMTEIIKTYNPAVA